MSNSLNIQLTTELRRFVDERASDDDVYATPSEYVRDLIRHDMQARKAAYEDEIAMMLIEATNSPAVPMEEDFFEKKRAELKARVAARKRIVSD